MLMIIPDLRIVRSKDLEGLIKVMKAVNISNKHARNLNARESFISTNSSSGVLTLSIALWRDAQKFRAKSA